MQLFLKHNILKFFNSIILHVNKMEGGGSGLTTKNAINFLIEQLK